ncbi:MAG: hypothetical protein IPP46_01175 [Bacteroidetes bacterium]|nr:hypothetical protein [Bacteroidota bacterium]
MKAETDFNPEEWVSWVLEHENEDTSTLALRYAGKKNLPLKALLHQIKRTAYSKAETPIVVSISHYFLSGFHHH